MTAPIVSSVLGFLVLLCASVLLFFERFSRRKSRRHDVVVPSVPVLTKNAEPTPAMVVPVVEETEAPKPEPVLEPEKVVVPTITGPFEHLDTSKPATLEPVFKKIPGGETLLSEGQRVRWNPQFLIARSTRAQYGEGPFTVKRVIDATSFYVCNCGLRDRQPHTKGCRSLEMCHPQAVVLETPRGVLTRPISGAYLTPVPTESIPEQD